MAPLDLQLSAVAYALNWEDTCLWLKASNNIELHVVTWLNHRLPKYQNIVVLFFLSSLSRIKIYIGGLSREHP